MKYLKQFFIILAVSFAGEILNRLIPLPVPGSIYGIVILFVLLCTGIVKVKDVKEVSKLLIEIMPIMFIPAAAGLIESWGVVKSGVIQYIVLTLVSTVVVMAVSGIVTQIFIRHGKKKEAFNC